MSKKLLHFSLLVLCLSAFAAAGLSAMDSGTVRFRTFGALVASDELYYDCKGVETKVALYDSARSNFYEFTPGKPLVFYRLAKGADGKPVHEEAAVATITNAGVWPLLFFIPNSPVDKRFTVTALADDLKSFPFPSCRFINQSDFAIDCKYGEQAVKLPAHGALLIDPRLKTGTSSETRYTTLSVVTPEGTRLLYSNNWVVRPNQRTLVFIASQGDGIQVTRIVDDQCQYIDPALPPR